MIFIILILLVIAFVLFVSYNSIVIKRNEIEKALSTLDAILKKRYDILPNVIASVQQAMQFESGTLLEQSEVRSISIGFITIASHSSRQAIPSLGICKW